MQSPADARSFVGKRALVGFEVPGEDSVEYGWISVTGCVGDFVTGILDNGDRINVKLGAVESVLP